MRFLRNILLISFFLVAGFYFYILIFHKQQKDYQSINVTGANWGDLSLLTEKKDQKYLDVDLEGKIVALFFGYLACPDFCPNHLSKMVLVKERLPKKIREKFAVLFISVDPERDTNENLKKFVRSFDSTFDGFAPNEKHLYLLKNEFKLVVSKGPKTEYGNYLVDHYTYTYLYDENENLRLLIPFDMSIEAIIKDVKRMVNNKLEQGLE
tara:strand:- start:99 stop:725 length:627 start_codon:yes stop_codon:yes gene_type:complete